MLPPGGSDRAEDALRLSRSLFPDLAQRYDAALARATARSGAAGPGDLHAPWARFDDDLDAAAQDRFAGAGFASIPDSPGRRQLAHDFATAQRVARELLRLPGSGVPEPEAFAAAGVDLAALVAKLDAARPDAALTAVWAPHGLDADVWRAAFARAAALPGSAFVPAGSAGSDDPTLSLGRDVEAEFARLNLPAGEALVVGDAPAWTLRLIPSEPIPEALGLNFTHGAPHVGLAEMLMLQLMRAIEAAPPLDQNSLTWLAGSWADGRLAARHVYDAGRIRITAREVGSQGPHLGARRPVA